MAKGDTANQQKTINYQGANSQNYLSGVQQQLYNTSAPLQNAYFGNQQGTTGSLYSGSPTDYQSIFNSVFPGNTLSSDQLWAAKDQLGQYGINVMTNASGVHGKVQLPNGQIVDVIQSAGLGGQGNKQWLTGGGGGYGGMGGIPGMDMGMLNSIYGNMGSLLGDYRNFYGQIPGMMGGFLGSAANMAKTGGISPTQEAEMRSRAISPYRAAYSQSVQDLGQQRALQGGYSPGFTTALGRLNRQQGQGMSDAVTNANAMIAELEQRGKLGGLSAWGSGLGTELGAMGSALGGQGNVLGGMASLYGTSPGMSRLFGDQLLQSNAQQLQAAGLQNQLGGQIMNAQGQLVTAPGNYDIAMNRIGGTADAIGNIGGAIIPWLTGGGNNPQYGNPYSQGYGQVISPTQSWGSL